MQSSDQGLVLKKQNAFLGHVHPEPHVVKKLLYPEWSIRTVDGHVDSRPLNGI